MEEETFVAFGIILVLCVDDDMLVKENKMLQGN